MDSSFKFVLLLSIFFYFSCADKPKESYDLLIRDAFVINLEDGTVSTKSVFIKAGRIANIVGESTLDTVAIEHSINAKGKYLLPGFWDNHVHFRGGDSLIDDNKNFLKLFIANGITTVRDAGGDLTNSVMQWKSEIEKEELLGPTIFTSGPKLDGPNATWAGSLAVEDEDDVAKALDSLQNIPTDYVKLYDSRISSAAYLKTIEEAEKRGIITSGHMPFTVELHEAIEAGIDGIEHLYYIMKGCSDREAEITGKLQNNKMSFWEAMPALQSSYSDSVARATFVKMKENHVFSIPTLHIGRTLSYLDEEDHSQDEYLKYMGNGIIKTYEGRINRVKNSTPEAVQNRKELDAFFGELAKTMSDAGVSLLAGSDSGAFNSYTYPGVSLHKELEAMVAVGISPLEALQNSAYRGSKFLKKENDYGSVTKGKIADLVLLNNNPLEDIRQTQNIAHVIKGNQILNAEDLKNLLASAENND
ncbi:hypothetical protein HME9304_00118 [Flagellimonas maritima]|uniref:Amidohydrolase-related domain-containing protein n=1 Tax=Flagellimonas maritima TaxID=1383885 RepID=A0A2Z4LMT3_9FLAO|nr:amidohydrolase family protein [Allomuricauda aurantiaca]AWX43131.1 hypothetical protein HME9304_00118 [Allomuricauda aurantiaca]